MKKYIRLIITFLFCITISITTVNAKSYIKDLFQYDEKLVIEKELDGTAFLLGEKVNVEKSINGIGFILGNTITIQDVQEYIFGISSKINMEANIKKDLFLFAEEINITGTINRDAYMYSTTSSLDGNFNRNVYIAGGTIELNGTFKGNVTIYATEIKLGDEVSIEGTLKYNKDANISGLTDEIATKTYVNKQNKISLQDYIYSFINSYINITILAVLLIFICERIFKKSLEQTKNNKITNLCVKGFIILIGIPILAFMTLMSGWFTSIGVVVGIIYGILIYVSTLFTGYFIAHELDKRYLKKNLNSYLLVIIGILIIKVLSIVPILGELVSLFSLLLGLGITGNMIIEVKK